MYQDLWDAAKSVLRWIFIAISTYIKKERSQINILTFYLKKPEKEEQTISPIPIEAMK